MALLVYPYRYAAANGWTETILPRLPRWLTVDDPAAVREYFAGNASLYRASAIRPWILPLGAWAAGIMALVLTTLCLSSLARRQWTEHERLAYPITQVPLLMTRPEGAVFRSALFWIGFSLAAGVNVLNALHLLIPVVPELVVKRHAWEWDGLGRPLSALNPVYVSWNPFLIGLQFFLPIDLLFSLWFFYALARLEGVFFAGMGIEPPGSAAEAVAPYAREQAFGAIVALLGFAIWTSRHGWREVWREFWRRPKRGLSAEQRISAAEPLPPRTAAMGVVLGVTAICLLLVGAGLPWWIAPVFVGIYLVVIASLTRVRAQFGPPAAGLLLAAPGPMMVGALGTEAFGPTGLHGVALLHWLGREFAGHPMPHQLEAFRVGAARQIAYRAIIGAILLGAAVGLLAAFWGILHLSYTLGQATAKVAGTQQYFGREAYALLAARLADPHRTARLDSLAAMVAGAGVTLALQSLRMRFVSFPFHPVGYALCSTYVSSFLWSTALITWLFKLILFRYAGLRGYRIATPFFLGLLLGEFVLGSLISLAGVLLRTRMYVFWPY
jgi:hypothetical protein